MNFFISLWPNIIAHAYSYLFIGMLLGGESFLLPAVYLALRGALNISFIILLASIATIISDSIWYAIGRYFPIERILSWKMFAKKKESFEKMFAVFKKHQIKLLFLSKFVYGTRTAAQVLSGSAGTPFLKYSVINLAGILSYLLFIISIAVLTRTSLASLDHILYYEYVYVLVFVTVLTIVHICLKKWLNKNFTAPSSQP